MNLEYQILSNALFNLGQVIPIKKNWNLSKKEKFDGQLEITINHQKLYFNTDIKNNISKVQLYKILKKNTFFDNFLVVANQIYPSVKQKLQKNNISYLEGNGNIYLNASNLFIYVNDNSNKIIPSQKVNRAFSKTGLKVIFQFLLKPQLINEPQRNIAKISNVALGSIPPIIKGLLDLNYILRLNKNKYIIDNYEFLLDKWAVEFEQRLKPKLFRQRFKFLNKNENWSAIKWSTPKTVWGGEAAGDIVTNYLRPEKLSLYSNETLRELMTNYLLTPDKKGNIEVYNMFWDNNLYNYAPLPLIYTDLMNTTDKRCIKTAKIILNEHLLPNL